MNPHENNIVQKQIDLNSMKKKFGFIFIIAVSCFISTQAQTKKELEAISTSKTKYIRNGVVMKPRFDENGQICRLILTNENDSDDVTLDGKTLISGKQVEEIVDLLFPLKLRGEKKTFGMSLFLGGIFITFYEYENIKISSTDIVPWNKKALLKRQGITYPNAETEKILAEKSEIKPAEHFVLNWTKRKCEAEKY